MPDFINRATNVAKRINSGNTAVSPLIELEKRVAAFRSKLKELGNGMPMAMGNTSREEVGGVDPLATQMATLRDDTFIRPIAIFQLYRETIDHLSAVVSLIENHSHGATIRVANLNKGIRKVQSNLEKLTTQTRSNFFAIGEYRLAQFVDQLAQGRIVRTPDVQKVIDAGKKGLLAKRSLTLHGDTGGGKTEIARIIAKELTGKDPLVIRCYHGMSVTDLYGTQRLESSDGNTDILGVLRNIQQIAEDWKSANPNPNPELERLVMEKIYGANSVTISKHIEGAVYRAARDGIICILDEFNALPDNIRLGLNDILTKKPGEKIVVQETGESIVVKEGFGYIQTGNINYDGGKKYTGRHGVEASQNERTHLEYVGALPQQILMDYSENRGIEHSQLFTIALTAALNFDLSLSAAPQNLDHNPLNSIWRLSQFASITQQAFSGKLDSTSPYVYQEGGTPVNVDLTTQISNRRLITIVETWKRSGTFQSLDNLLLEVIRQAVTTRERRFLYQLAQTQGFFNVEQGWPQEGTLTSLGAFDTIKPPTIEPKPIMQVDKTAVIEACFGRAPAGAEALVQGESAMRIKELIKSYEEKLPEWKAEYGSVCPTS